MRELVEKKEVTGAVTCVVTRDGVVHLEAVGKADLAADAPMRTDTICWIASMTKPVTGAAVMMMQDEGKLSIDDPVTKYLPEFATLKTADGKSLAKPITIKHLLTHTAGMSEASDEEARAAKTLAEMIPVYTGKPVQFEAGSRWQYSQSSINTAGRIVEIVSGRPLDRFLQERLFGPLGMQDTTFYLSDDQMKRTARPYSLKDGKLEPAEVFILLGKRPTDRDRFPAANGGLYSTAPDYAKFCQMILRGGELGGKRYLKPETVKQMTSLQTGELQTGFTPGNGWGIGWGVVRQPQGASAALSPGSFGHGGAYGTQAWIDPAKGVAYLLFVQRANFPNADASEARKAFQDAAAGALVGN